MTEIVVAINEQDCTSSDGNTAEEGEAIAVTFLRAAEALRNHEEGKMERLGLMANLRPGSICIPAVPIVVRTP